MSDDETKKDETTPDEGAEAAGPAAAGDPPSPAEQETVPPTTSPTAEAESADESDAPAEEAADAAPAAEEASEPNPEDDLPWKERLRLQKSRRSRKDRSADLEERKAERATERSRKAELRRKQRAALKTERTPGTGTPPAERESNAAKVRQGIVVSSKGDKSITVRIDIARRHRTYEKIVRSSTKLHAHDERNEAGEGDVVRVIETRPLSKTKRWRLVDVVEKAR
jgi:small subunit ribosomal protein S17